MVDIQALIAYWKEENEERFKDVEKYESFYGKFTDVFEESDIYTKYYCEFEHNIELNTDYKELYDPKMLLQLVAASFASDYELKVNDLGLIDLVIKVQSNLEKEEKYLIELFYEQINPLFEIYIHEQINFFNMMAECEVDAKEIQAEQQKQIDKFHNQVLPQLEQDLKTFELTLKFRKKIVF